MWGLCSNHDLAVPERKLVHGNSKTYAGHLLVKSAPAYMQVQIYIHYVLSLMYMYSYVLSLLKLLFQLSADLVHQTPGVRDPAWLKKMK